MWPVGVACARWSVPRPRGLWWHMLALWRVPRTQCNHPSSLPPPSLPPALVRARRQRRGLHLVRGGGWIKCSDKLTTSMQPPTNASRGLPLPLPAPNLSPIFQGRKRTSGQVLIQDTLNCIPPLPLPTLSDQIGFCLDFQREISDRAWAGLGSGKTVINVWSLFDPSALKVGMNVYSDSDQIILTIATRTSVDVGGLLHMITVAVICFLVCTLWTAFSCSDVVLAVVWTGLSENWKSGLVSNQEWRMATWRAPESRVLMGLAQKGRCFR